MSPTNHQTNAPTQILSQNTTAVPSSTPDDVSGNTGAGSCNSRGGPGKSGVAGPGVSEEARIGDRGAGPGAGRGTYQEHFIRKMQRKYIGFR